MYKLHIKLNRLKPELSRTLYVPDNMDFKKLDTLLREVFDFTYAHLSIFEFDGLKTPMWDFDKTFPDTKSVDMNGTQISDYLELIKKFYWTYDLNKSYVFTVSIRRPNKKYDTDYPFIESYKCDFNPIEDCHPLDFEEMLYFTLNGERLPDYLPDFDMEKFDLDEANERLKNF